jgi:1-acyl-sn-glycerol-3-phosphate acyltransferase
MTRRAAPAAGRAAADRQPIHSPAGRCLYAVLWVLSRTLAVALLGFRVRFAAPVPPTGGLILLSSHQSHLDPLLVGLALDRRMSSLARNSLYAFSPFGAAIRALDAVPIDRNASMVQALKAVIERLDRGGAVLIFPEGTRTSDGRLGEIKAGFALMARKAGVPILPVAIVGAYECWPRSRLLPRPGRVRLEFGAPITPEAVAGLDDRTVTALCAERIRALDAEARRMLAGGVSPPPGRGPA